jgi:protease YdgD
MRACLAALLVAVLAGTGSIAQDVPVAIGRISYAASPAADAAICTGTLVAADLVLTAGHCLRGARDDAGGVWFALADRDGQGSAPVQGAEVILIDGAVAGDFARDLALLRLAQPIPADRASALPLAMRDADTFTVVAYRRDAPMQAVRRDDCNAVTAPPSLLGLTCPVVSGNSGAPVLQRIDAGWQVVAVIVASANGGRLQALAAIPPPAFRAQIAERRATAP